MKKKTGWLHVLAISIVATFGAVAIACGGDIDNGAKGSGKIDSPAVGVYYYDYGDAEYLLSLNNDGSLVLAIGGDALSGKYSITDSGAITFNVNSDLLSANAVYANDAVTLTYGNVAYKFLRNVEYTVTFDSGEGSAVASKTVRNGRKVEKPDDPQYDGHVFIGWYRNANAQDAFKFSSDVVTGDLTLYAGWLVKTDRDEYEVKFDLGYGEQSLYVTATTIGGKVYDEIVDPERDGYTFKGWWSKDEASGEYSMRIDLIEYEFSQNETVYALWQSAAEGGKLVSPIVDVNVAANRIAWEVVSGASGYVVTVTDPDGNEWTKKESGVSVVYDLGFTKAGTYTVEVYAESLGGADKNSDVTIRKFVNKQLAKVSGFTVVGNSLIYSGVENATKYLLYIECGDELHEHNPYDNGNSKEYNFEDCVMQEGGIKFRVEAQADGYVSSVSDVFVVERTLEQVTGFEYDEETETVSWAAVENAADYTVTVVCADPKQGFTTVLHGVTEVNIGTCDAGTVKITVVARNGRKYIPSESAEYTVTKARSAAVTGLAVNEYTLSWADFGADKYIVDINGTINEVTENSLALDGLTNVTWTKGQSYSIKVRAVKGDDVSSWSLPLKANYLTLDGVAYNDGVLSWTSVIGASGYQVTVNNADPMSVRGNNTPVTFTDKVNVIKVYVNGSADVQSITVNAYAVTFDCNGGDGAPDSYYFATGDTIVLPEAGITRRGYDFAGWYTSAVGNSVRYLDGDRYELDTDLTLYARWDGKEYVVKLNYNRTGDSADEIATATVKYGEEFSLDVPEIPKSSIHGFLGWNTSANGNGEAITDQTGKSLSGWHYDDTNIVLYAQWGVIFEFVKYGTGNNSYYVVSKGVDTPKLTEIEIPEEYQGENDERPYPVTTIGGNAFSACSNITSMTIPVSVTTIESTAFTSLSKLESITIKGGIPGVSRYWSIDGVVFGLNNLNNRTQIEFFPRGRTGEYTMPTGIEDIPYEGFLGASIEKLIIPYTVTRVANAAFYSNASGSSYCKIKEIVFAEPDVENATVLPLNITSGAFKSMLYLTDITFPSRTINFTDINGAVQDEIDFKADVFYGCSALARIEVAEGNAVYVSIDHMLCKKDPNGSDITVVFCPNSYNFENGAYTTSNRLTIIGKHAFSAVRYLNTLEVGASIYKIEDEAFSGFRTIVNSADITISAATALTSVRFMGGRGAGLTIGRAAFGNTSTIVNSSTLYCKALSLVEFEEGSNVTEIGNYAFAYSALKEFTFPSTLKQIGYGAFKNNTLLETVQISGDDDGLEITNVFGNDEDEIARAGVFEQCTSLTTITIPKNVTKLSGGVFLGCKSLTTVNVDPENPVLVFIDGILYGKDATTQQINAIHYILPNVDMSTFVLPDGITEINAGVFANVGDQIKELTINKYVTYVGAEAFKGTGIQKVVFLNKESNDEDGADTLILGTGVFSSCASLTEVILPARLKVIPSSAFTATSALQSIVLPDGLTEIGDNAFSNSGVTSIAIPNTVERIGYCAFYYARSLQTVTFAPDGTKELAFTDSNGDYGIKPTGELAGSTMTFYYCSALTEVILPERLVNIGQSSFYYCSSLVTVRIPTTVRSIGNSAFSNCTKLKNVWFTDRAPDGSETLTLASGNVAGGGSGGSISATGMFYLCSALEEIALPNGLDRIADCVFQGCAALTTVHIPSSVHNTLNGYYDSVKKTAVAPLLGIGNSAFNGCSALTTLDFADDDPQDLVGGERGWVLSFSDSALPTTAPNLTSITLPARYGGYTKGASATLTYVYTGVSRTVFKSYVQELFVKPNGVNFKSDENGLLYSVDGTELVFCPTGKTGKVVIPYTVTKIASALVYSSTTITSGAFSACTGITEIEFQPVPNGVTALPLIIGDNTADMDTGFTSDGVFKGCTGLTSVTLPARLSQINSYAFSGCSNLRLVNFEDDCALTVIANRAFADCPKLVGTNVSASGQPSYAFVVPKDVTSIGDAAFINDTSLTALVFAGMTFDGDGNVTEDISALGEIGISAFEKAGLTSVYLPKSVVTLGSGVFASCAQLTSADLPNTVSSLNNVFGNCGKLARLNLYSVAGSDSNFVSDSNSIVYQTDADGNKILSYYPISLTKTELTADDLAGVTSIADNAFASNRYLQKITIPNTVTAIGANAFRHCISLKTVVFETDTTATENIGLTITNGNSTSGIFYGCYNLETVSFPKRLTGLGDYTLAYLPKLSSVTFPDDCKLTVINQYAFSGSGTATANGLSVNIPSNVTEFKNYVFGASSAAAAAKLAATIVIPDSVKTFGTYLFGYVSGLKQVEFKTPTTARSNLTFGGSMFANCPDLENVTLPGDLVNSGTSTFLNCTNLKSITLPNSLVKIDTSMFSGCVNLEKINSTVTGTAVIPSAVTTINGTAFLNCQKITKFELNTGLQIIGNSAFAGTSITSITIPNTVYGTSTTGSVGYMFSNNSTGDARIAADLLTEVKFASGNKFVKSLVAKAFYALPNLKTVELPEEAPSFVTINNNAFTQSGITSIKIPKTVTGVLYNAFDSCTDLKDVTFEKDDNGDCALLWIGLKVFYNCTSLKSIEIPKTAKLMASATSYATYVFQGCTSLETVVFEKGSVITNFTSAATGNSYHFSGCTALKTVRLPDNLSVPGVNLFQGCTSLETVILPTTLTTIPNYMFDGCASLAAVKYGDVDYYMTKPEDVEDGDTAKYFEDYVSVASGITSIGDYAFRKAGLVTFDIPAGVSTIGQYAFSECIGLEQITIPANVTSVGNYAFYKSGVETLTFATGSKLTTIGTYAFAQGVLSGSIVIPASVTTINASAFYITDITSVTFGEEGEESNLKTLGNYAFRQCTLLTAVSLPASLTSIGYNPFAYCTALEMIEVDGENENFVSIGGLAVYDRDMTAIYIYATGNKPNEGEELLIEIGGDANGITEVKPYAFFGGYITKLIVGDDVTIGTYAFQANDLTEITLGENVTLNSYAFRYNQSLTDVTIGEGAVIGAGAFDYCTALEAIAIPANSSLDASAFTNCDVLTLDNITVSEDTAIRYLGYDAIVGEDGTVTIIVYPNSAGSFTTFSGNTTITSVILADGITTMPTNAFFNCTNLRSVVLPNTLTDIVANAFRSDTALEYINIPSSVKTIGTYAFYGCPLTDLELEFGGLVSLGNYGFYSTGIKSVKFGPNFNSLGTNAFRYCENLTSVIFDENGVNVAFGTSLTSSTNYFFSGCPNIETFVFSGNQAAVNAYLLDGDTALKSITIPATVASIGAYAFRGCTSLTEVTLEKNKDGSCALTTLGNYAFNGTAISNISIPATVTDMGTYTFANCTSLTSITFEKNADGTCGFTTIGKYLLSGTAITAVNIPKTVATIDEGAFSDCSSLATVTFDGLADGDYALTKLNKNCFINTAIETFVIPDKVTTVTTPFAGDKLKSLTLSPNMTAVPDLQLCTALETLIVPEGITTVAGSYLAGLTGISRLELPSTLTTLGDNVFKGWTAQQTIVLNGVTAPSSGWGKYWRVGCEATILWDGEEESYDTSADEASVELPEALAPDQND